MTTLYAAISFLAFTTFAVLVVNVRQRASHREQVSFLKEKSHAQERTSDLLLVANNELVDGNISEEHVADYVRAHRKEIPRGLVIEALENDPGSFPTSWYSDVLDDNFRIRDAQIAGYLRDKGLAHDWGRENTAEVMAKDDTLRENIDVLRSKECSRCGLISRTLKYGMPEFYHYEGYFRGGAKLDTADMSRCTGAAHEKTDLEDAVADVVRHMTENSSYVPSIDLQGLELEKEEAENEAD